MLHTGAAFPLSVTVWGWRTCSEASHAQTVTDKGERHPGMEHHSSAPMMDPGRTASPRPKCQHPSRPNEHPLCRRHDLQFPSLSLGRFRRVVLSMGSAGRSVEPRNDIEGNSFALFSKRDNWTWRFHDATFSSRTNLRRIAGPVKWQSTAQ